VFVCVTCFSSYTLQVVGGAGVGLPTASTSECAAERVNPYPLTLCCVVLFLLCVCLCDLFLFLYPAGPSTSSASGRAAERVNPYPVTLYCVVLFLLCVCLCDLCLFLYSAGPSTSSVSGRTAERRYSQLRIHTLQGLLLLALVAPSSQLPYRLFGTVVRTVVAPPSSVVKCL